MIKFVLPLIPLLWLAGCSQAPAPTVDLAPTAVAQRTPGPGEYLVKRGDTLFRIARDNGMSLQELAALNSIADPSVLREGQILRLKPGAPAVTAAALAEPLATPVGVASGVETRSLDAPVAVPVATTPGAIIKTPKGGKEPYSDEAFARLNRSDAPATPAAPVTPPATPAAAVTPAAAAPDKAAPLAWPTGGAVRTGWGVGGSKGYDFAGKLGDPVLAAGDGRVLYVGKALAGMGELIIVKHDAELLSVYAHNSKLLVKEGQNVKRGQKIAEMGSTGTDSVKLHFQVRKQGVPVDPGPYLPKR